MLASPDELNGKGCNGGAGAAFSLPLNLSVVG
jgi:hypothetical protein